MNSAATNTIVGRDLVVDYSTASGPVRALELESLSVEGGSSVAVMGQSGCGKSTLLGLLAGLAVPSAGTVTIGNIAISQLAERERVRFRRQVLGMVYQADNLLSHLTVEENVGLQLAICRRHGVDEANPTKVLERLGLGALTKRFPDQLSGGQRQRVAVARAVIHRPAVILADEPTGSLDGDSARMVIELLVEVQRQMDATLVLVTHDPHIAGYADRIVELTRPQASDSRC